MRSFANAPERILKVKIWLFIIILLVAAITGMAQQKPITGVVRNAEDNQPVPQATVTVKGTRTVALTNNQGSFTIQAAPNQTLVVTVVGYQPMEKAVGQQTVINFSLAGNTAQMQDVVVTALGIRREEKALGYSTTTVKGEQLTDAVAGNWTDALSGKVAGLNLVRSNSGPTGSNKIILRGENNLTGDNEALIVVDGVVINQGSGRRSAIGGETAYGTGSDNMPADYGSGLNDINPEDIESVTVLKGPGAAALYGQRGANGAIIITTKSGNAKRNGWGVTLNSNVSVENVNRWPEFQWEYGQGLDGNDYYSFGASPDGASTSATSSAYGPRFNGQMFYQYDPATQSRVRNGRPGYPTKTSCLIISIPGKPSPTLSAWMVVAIRPRPAFRLPMSAINGSFLTPAINEIPFRCR
jgi:TonB-dependent SusC/RagA subfamily outer membrane receptor